MRRHIYIYDLRRWFTTQIFLRPWGVHGVYRGPYCEVPSTLVIDVIVRSQSDARQSTPCTLHYLMPGSFISFALWYFLAHPTHLREGRQPRAPNIPLTPPQPHKKKMGTKCLQLVWGNFRAQKGQDGRGGCIVAFVTPFRKILICIVSH